MSSSGSDRGPDAGAATSGPVCTILAGANGSGKSSLFDVLRPVGTFVNADLIARGADLGPAQAARRTITRLDTLLLAREDFVFETTLSSHHAIALMRRARSSGYEVGLVFVALTSADLAVRRVAQRVGLGGHHIPEDDIRRRYPRSFKNLARAVSLAHGSLIYDNSERPPVLLARIAGRTLEATCLDEMRPHHVRIANALAEALECEVKTVFGQAGCS